MNFKALLPILFWPVASSHEHHARRAQSQDPIAADTASINNIPFSTRAYWMRRANAASAELASPCPFAAFGTVIVNHTDSSKGALGKLVCIGINENGRVGNPVLHGEIAAINNCSSILTNSAGSYNLTAGEALDAFAKLSIYTNGESCPMCASAIRWAGFREYIYGTSIDTIIEQGWGQIRISSLEVFRRLFDLSTQSGLIGPILANETDPLFAWQFDPAAPCPEGCARGRMGVCENS
ncbi:cytidine deaminase-like protein [Mytilinidion resinicola]|uniref:Cytidine deaminase-like protein n=1 Tax=Mytilinidion resinicola TaxID=574789 RepID=A0A6A6Y9U1_9PEZI|nr:cytidine deaminase-like protein [Mytilinidion resinicola]KAF2805470.1 cytidine deaminase-like protein [Mytilinidion resinicola]